MTPGVYRHFSVMFFERTMGLANCLRFGFATAPFGSNLGTTFFRWVAEAMCFNQPHTSKIPLFSRSNMYKNRLPSAVIDFSVRPSTQSPNVFGRNAILWSGYSDESYKHSGAKRKQEWDFNNNFSPVYRYVCTNNFTVVFTVRMYLYKELFHYILGSGIANVKSLGYHVWDIIQNHSRKPSTQNT